MRIVGEVTQERAEILRAADAIVVDEIRRAGLDRELWQSFAVLPAVRTVGVMGDGRTYAYPIVDPGGHERRRHDRRLGPPPLRPARADLDADHQRGRRREPRGLDVTSKPPGTIEWE